MPSPPDVAAAPSWPQALLWFALGTWITLVLMATLLRFGGRRLPVPEPPPPFLPAIGALAIMIYLGLTLLAPAVLPDGDGATESLAVSLVATCAIHFGVIAAALLHARRSFGAPPRALGFGGAPPAAFGLAALALVALIPAYYGALVLNDRLVEWFGWQPSQELVAELQRDPALLRNPLLIAGTVVIGPFCEEAIFRGLVQRSLRVVGGALPSIAGGAILFAMVHDVQSWLPIFVVGVVLGIVCERTGSIWPPLLLHGLFNGVQLAILGFGPPAHGT